ncbi:lysophosphatidic acid receptor 6 [Erpetoichthys calabaricus]|uniref:Lysophosphatidic acid receptor 6-like n=1 Tax=Erpetoichthys calabaricus TaxID=27687 RepID=A0A8C4SA12_ERPCA|nr:lysophosphatidic acid receptor 6 [Erpetoichthys calabaricus]
MSEEEAVGKFPQTVTEVFDVDPLAIMTNSTVNWFFVGAYSFIFIVGLILNLIALIIFCCYIKSRSTATVYMVNLVFADLLLLISLPLRIYFYAGGFLREGICIAVGMFMFINMYGSIFLLACINWDRFLAICFPMNMRIKEVRKKAFFFCLGAWILAVGPSIAIKMNNKNATNECFNNKPIFATQTGAVVSTMIVGFGIPLLSMIICSIAIVKALAKSMAAHTELVNKKKIHRMLVVNITLFLLCFLPYHTMLLFLPRYEFGNKMKLFYQISLLLACANTMLDPIVYYFVTKTFRESVSMKPLRRRMCAFNSSSSDETKHFKMPLNT